MGQSFKTISRPHARLRTAVVAFAFQGRDGQRSAGSGNEHAKTPLTEPLLPFERGGASSFWDSGRLGVRVLTLSSSESYSSQGPTW